MEAQVTYSAGRNIAMKFLLIYTKPPLRFIVPY